MKTPRDHALGLLSKAGQDLVAAEAILAACEAYDMACFHAQQAVEKSPKALLAATEDDYPWKHDLRPLLDRVMARCTGFADLEDDILALNPYAVAVRYDDELLPDSSEAAGAIRTARKVHDLARRRLNPD